MNIRQAIRFVLFLYPIAQGGLGFPASPPHPNDVLSPPVSRPQQSAAPSNAPLKSSGRTELLLGSMGFASALLPLISQLTSSFQSGKADTVPAAPAATVAVAQADHVSRLPRSVGGDDESQNDSFIGLANPVWVLGEIATILADVFTYTETHGLTDFTPINHRSRRDILYRQDEDAIYYGPDLSLKFTPESQVIYLEIDFFTLIISTFFPLQKLSLGC